MKKRYIIVLSLIIVILSASYISAADNSTNVLKNQKQDLISINTEENDTISSEEESSIGMIIENNTSSVNDNEILGSAENMETLTLSPEDILSSEVTVAPLTSSAYKTPTKKQRTFNIGGFKAVLSQSQYKKFYKISSIEDYFFEGDYNYYYVGEKYKGYDITSSGLRKTLMVKTSKYVKVKLKIGKKVKYKKSRVYMIFSYGDGQYGVPYRHIVQLVHYYNTYDRSYDSVKVIGKNAKYFTKCKHSTSFAKLNKAKLSGKNYVYKKYSLY